VSDRPPIDIDTDATRHTWLANERTMLAWLRTGLTATAVALAVGKLIPDLGHHHTTRWPYTVIGTGYGLFGVALIAYGLHRRAQVDEAIRAGDYAAPTERALAVLGLAAVVLGLAVGIVVAVDA
jgi:putative membrane protein